MAYDVVIKGGEVVDPGQGLRGHMDVGIADGKVAGIGEDIPIQEYTTVVDARGKLVVPGLIDFHVHLGPMHGESQGDPDVIGLRQGVTLLVEGGSLGAKTFAAAEPIIAGRQTEVKWFVNLAARGLEHVPEIASEADVDPEATIRLIEERRDLIGGVKLRAIGTVAMGIGPRAAEMAKRIAASAGLPVMVHVGACFSELNDERALAAVDDYARYVLPLLEAGDIITHVYSPKRGRVSDAEMNPLPELVAAVKRGVLTEVAHGRTNFSSPVAQHMIAQGIVPDIVSTDGSVSNMPAGKSAVPGGAHPPFYDEAAQIGPVAFLARTMSKMLALGFSLERRGADDLLGRPGADERGGQPPVGAACCGEVAGRQLAGLRLRVTMVCILA
jgi:dihydroorotase